MFRLATISGSPVLSIPNTVMVDPGQIVFRLITPDDIIRHNHENISAFVKGENLFLTQSIVIPVKEE